LPWRWTDDSTIDESCARRRDDSGDPAHGFHVDCVAIGKNCLVRRAGQRRCETLGKRERLVGREDGEDHVGPGDGVVIGANHARRFGPAYGCDAATCQRCEHTRTVLAKATTHRAAHGAGRYDSDFGQHQTVSGRENGLVT
jgi:hypothetical protein